MADRGGFSGRRGPRGSGSRGGGGGPRGGGAQRGGGGRGGRGRNDDGAGLDSGAATDRPRRDNILDLSKYLDKELRVKFVGGREVRGVLKGFDQLMNLVLDEVVETMMGESGEKVERSLGLLVARGTTLMLIAPTESEDVIKNPFMND